VDARRPLTNHPTTSRYPFEEGAERTLLACGIVRHVVVIANFAVFAVFAFASFAPSRHALPKPEELLLH
jgi:hypothetical protein